MRWKIINYGGSSKGGVKFRFSGYERIRGSLSRWTLMENWRYMWTEVLDKY